MDYHYQQSQRIEMAGYMAVQEIDRYAESVMNRQNEAVYAAYTDMINGIYQSGKTHAETAGGIVVQALDKIDKLNDSRFDSIINCWSQILFRLMIMYRFGIPVKGG